MYVMVASMSFLPVLKLKIGTTNSFNLYTVGLYSGYHFSTPDSEFSNAPKF